MNRMTRAASSLIWLGILLAPSVYADELGDQVAAIHENDATILDPDTRLTQETAPTPAAPRLAPAPTPPRLPTPAAPTTSAPRPPGTAAASVPTTPATPSNPGYESALLASPASPMLPGDAGTFGTLSGLSVGGIPQMIGDLGPPSSIRLLANGVPGLPQPFPPPRPPGVPQARLAASVIPALRGIKISENQSPRPQDRFYFTYNYFQGVNDSLNRELRSPVGYTQLYRYVWGFEKTFFDGQWSIGLRFPLNTVTAKQTLPSTYGRYGGTSTAMGDMSIYFKSILLEDKETGSLLSWGLAVSPPIGPGRFAAAPGFASITHTTTFQPFLGFIWNAGDLYFHGFTAIDVPANGQDVTLYYNDLGVGYFLRRDDPNSQLNRFITTIAPTFEVHVTDPLNHRKPFTSGDPVAMRDIVNLTYGLNLGIYKRSLLTLGCVTPVTGPKPFNMEAMLLLNVFYGGSARRGPSNPPIVGAY